MNIIKTVSDYLKELKLKILERRDVALHPGSVVHDTILVPSSVNVYTISFLLDYVSKLQSLDLILEILADETYLEELGLILGKSLEQIQLEITDHLDKIASSYQVTRRAATFAEGSAWFGRKNLPEADYTITVGSIASTIDNRLYSVTEERIMYQALGTQYYDPEMNLYLIEVPIKAQSSGSIGNASAYSINKLVTAISGITHVLNKEDVSGGLDEETDEELVDRIKEVFIGNNLSTKTGLRRLVMDDFDISDCYVVSAGDPEMIRDNGFGGCNDIYIQKKSVVEKTWIDLVYNGIDDYTYIPDTVLKPIENITLIDIPSGSYTFEKDTTSVYANSTKSKDRIRWDTKPPADTYTMTYNHDQNVSNVQSFLDNDENKPLGSDNLVKQANPLLVDIAFQITVAVGYNKQTVILAVNSKISSNIGAYKLGEGLQQSDVIAWAYEVDGVDKVILPMGKFNEKSLTGVVDEITVNNTQYIKINSLTIL